jgi:predicted thioesterase
MAIEVGASATERRLVEPDMTADRWGNAGVFVLATPTLVGLLEVTAVHAIEADLQPGQSTVGTHVDLKHLKATRVGDMLTLKAQVVEVNGRRVRFRVSAEDSQGMAGEGTHERVLIDLQRFLERVQRTE